jgi:hypothetical protein
MDAQDSHGTNTLTNIGSVTYSTGLIGKGADLGTSNTSKYLSISSDLGINGGNISIRILVKIRTALATGATTILAAQRTSGSTKILYTIRYYNESGVNKLKFYRTRLGVVDTFASYNVTLSTTNFQEITLTYDGTNIKGYLDGTEVASAAASGSGTGTYTGLFQLGSYVNIQHSSSIIDEAALWSKALTSTEVVELNNSGSPIGYDSFTSGHKTNLISYWKLDGATVTPNFFPFLLAHAT